MIPKVKPDLKLDSQIVVLLTKQDREAFIALCKDHNSDASTELRAYVKHVLDKLRTPEDLPR